MTLQRLFYIFVSLFLSVTAYSQVRLELVADSQGVQDDGVVKLTIKLEIVGADMFQETPLRSPDLSKFNIIGDASEQNTFVDTEKNLIVNQQVFQYILEPKQSGNVKIGSFLVTVNGKIYKTEPFDLLIDEKLSKAKIPERNRDENVYLDVEIDNRDLYENQPTIAVLRAYSRDVNNFRKVYNIQFPHQDEVIVKPVSYRKSEIEQDAKNGMASQIMAVFIIYPKRSGRVDVAPVSAIVKTSDKKSKIISNKVRLNVKDLPNESPDNFKDAVGSFNVDLRREVTLEEGVQEIGKPVNVLLKISGSGNLEEIVLPKLKESGQYSFYKPQVISKTKTTSKGEQGEILVKYIVVPKTAGTIQIATEPFTYFNPTKKEYVKLGEKAIQLNVLTKEQALDAKTTMEKVNKYTNDVLETVNTPIVETESFKVKESNKFSWRTVLVNYGIIGGAILLFTAFLGLRSHRRNLKASTENKNKTSTVSETEAKIRETEKLDVTTYFAYLERLLDDHNFKEFFVTFDELCHDVEKEIQKKNPELTFRSYLETQKGEASAEKFRNLQQQIQMEKYAPEPSVEHMSEIFEAIKSLFKDIIK